MLGWKDSQRGDCVSYGDPAKFWNLFLTLNNLHSDNEALPVREEAVNHFI
jgi:hypothetical protein